MVNVAYKERGLLIIETLFQQLLAVFVLLVLWEVFKNYSLSSANAWHVVLCTIGVALCMAEGLLLFNKENAFLKDVDRPNRGSIHGVVMLIGCVSLTTGIALKINQKTNHFKSTHAILGLVTWILVFVAIILGCITWNIKRFPSLGQPALCRIIHLFFGLSAYIMGVVTLGFGLQYLEWYTGTNGRNALIVFLSLYVAYSLLGPIRSCYYYFFR